MPQPVGYYVHHHGIGHWRRAVAVARAMATPCTLIGTFNAAQQAAAPGATLNLADDAPVPGATPGVPPPLLHYAPLRHSGLRRRSAALAAWMGEADPALLVVDVSAEAALLARLCSVPVALFRLAGRRDDPPHLHAFAAAQHLVAPFPAALEDPATPDWVVEKTFYAGFLTDVAAGTAPVAERSVTVVFGQGGTGGDAVALAAAARATPGWRWRVIGPVSGDAALPANLELLGWVADPQPLLAGAAVLVGGAGDGLVAEAAALAKPFLCLPEPRPFGEQTLKAQRLAELGAACVLPEWPAAADWPGLLDRALALDPARIGALHAPGAVGRLAGWLDGVASAA
ncbi:glycosyltransferase [Roseomonas haemaphysalidis]|uniref:Glycosyltransferase n=1 Tax=Roseomonas haemaphysalidis TaxID=2768162 RepID=A0ABS3KUK0_9PROT|nr:glycosyltransferase [Roseomonas haemaphysalidis]MBO1081160.1 glycosyltransferase [Roseomonas haemaphysalidis]